MCVWCFIDLKVALSHFIYPSASYLQFSDAFVKLLVKSDQCTISATPSPKITYLKLSDLLFIPSFHCTPANGFGSYSKYSPFPSSVISLFWGGSYFTHLFFFILVTILKKQTMEQPLTLGPDVANMFEELRVNKAPAFPPQDWLRFGRSRTSRLEFTFPQNPEGRVLAGM